MRCRTANADSLREPPFWVTLKSVVFSLLNAEENVFPSGFQTSFHTIYIAVIHNVGRMNMGKENVKWDDELLAVLSMYANTSVGKLKGLIVQLAEDLCIELPTQQ